MYKKILVLLISLLSFNVSFADVIDECYFSYSLDKIKGTKEYTDFQSTISGKITVGELSNFYKSINVTIYTKILGNIVYMVQDIDKCIFLKDLHEKLSNKYKLREKLNQKYTNKYSNGRNFKKGVIIVKREFYDDVPREFANNRSKRMTYLWGTSGGSICRGKQ